MEMKHRVMKSYLTFTPSLFYVGH